MSDKFLPHTSSLSNSQCESLHMTSTLKRKKKSLTQRNNFFNLILVLEEGESFSSLAQLFKEEKTFKMYYLVNEA